jgi:MerR family transcriptional regulator, heat shock protein HspR
MKKRGNAAHLISSVASTYNIHPQTLRLYERHGLLKPSRSEGNTRLYSAEDLERLEVILNLTRELGVNLAGVEIILNMRAKMETMEEEIREFMSYVQREFGAQSEQIPWKKENALVRRTPPSIIRFNR